MRVKSVRFLTVWEDNPRIENQNIDVFVELEDGYTYVLVAGTTRNIEYLIDKDKKNYFEPGIPFVIVKEFAKNIIEEAVKAYVEKDEGYWLKYYHFAGEIDKTVFDELQAKHIQEFKDEKLDDL